MSSVARDQLAALDAALASEGLVRVSAILRDLAGAGLSLADVTRLSGWIAARRSALEAAGTRPPVRLAILGGYTTQPVAVALPVAALSEGLLAGIYEAPYGTLHAAVLDPHSDLYRFAPHLVLFATGAVNVHAWPTPGDSPETVDALVDKTVEEWQGLWRTVRERSGAAVLQHTFEEPALAVAGRLERGVSWSRRRFLDRLNERFWQLDGREVRLLDVAALAGRVGAATWQAPRWYFHSKHGFNPAHIGVYLRAAAGLLRSLLVSPRKCLVVDLDNTLWGGTIGDDGLDGILLGPGTGEGEAYQAFGEYLRALRARGVLLAVCSKNEERIARAVFVEHAFTPLRLDDFAAFVCGWEPKPSGLRQIATTLNLGLDSLVFADDDAAECALVRRELPEVTVVPLEGDPADYPARIDERHLFEPLQLTAEDTSRAAAYAAAPALDDTRARAVSLDAFLADLRMVAEVAPASTGDLPRVEQLFAKTNQFNLTGARWDFPSLSARLAGRALCLVGRLTDRLANHGIVSAVVAHVEDGDLVVDNWVMSCRVFARTFEDYTLKCLVEEAVGRGCRRVRGRFAATAKNAYAARWLRERGLLDETTDAWALDTSSALPPTPALQAAVQTG